MKINKGQIKKIHVLKRQLGLTDEEYGAALESLGVISSKDLTHEEAALLIRRMIELLPKELKQKYEENPKKLNKKYDNLEIRYNEQLKEHYATPKQLRMIEAMWMTSPRVNNKTEEAFVKFVKRITGIDRMEWLLISDIRKIVKAIKSL